MNLLGHLETDGVVNALNSIVFLANMALGAQLAIICVTFELSLQYPCKHCISVVSTPF